MEQPAATHRGRDCSLSSRDRTTPSLVSYIMPVLNEADCLRDAVHAVLQQDYPGAFEVILAVGPSQDGTEDIAADLSRGDPRVTVIANSLTDIPAGLNRAIAAAEGEVIIRVDAHAELPHGYTRTMVETLCRTGAANVGGVMRARGRGAVQKAIARAYNSPLGLGGGVYHGRGEEGEADSAYLGVFRGDVLRAVGGYDESLRRGEDYDLNQRIRASGHRVWFDPTCEVTYWPRASWSALASQMWATGAWRGELVRRGSPTPWRYLIPPALVAALSASAGVAVARAVGLRASPRSALHAAPLAYVLFLGLGAVRLGGVTPKDRMANARALATMHLSWGAGFLRGVVVGGSGTVDRSRVAGLGRS